MNKLEEDLRDVGKQNNDKDVKIDNFILDIEKLQSNYNYSESKFNEILEHNNCLQKSNTELKLNINLLNEECAELKNKFDESNVKLYEQNSNFNNLQGKGKY